IPDLQAELFHAVRGNDLAAARRLNDRIYPLARVFYADPWADMHNRMKEALVLLGRLPRAVVRPPLVKLTRAEIERIRAALVEAGLLDAKAPRQSARDAARASRRASAGEKRATAGGPARPAEAAGGVSGDCAPSLISRRGGGKKRTSSGYARCTAGVIEADRMEAVPGPAGDHAIGVADGGGYGAGGSRGRLCGRGQKCRNCNEI